MSEGTGIFNNAGPASGGEPSMEEILASIRRILTEEEQERSAAPAPEPDDDILVLDSTTMVPPPQGNYQQQPPPPPPPQENGAYSSQPFSSQPFSSEPALDSRGVAAQPQSGAPQYIPASVVETPTNYAPLTKKETYMEDQVQSPLGLVSDQAANEIANSVGSLVRSVSTERSVQIGRPGVTIEDLVREEVKPVLKAWLDSHLPSLVERVVRAEIGRVVDRM